MAESVTSALADAPPRVPELLAPAGCRQRLEVAVRYGADAVYVGGQRYGLRARADNFTPFELAESVRFATDHGVKVYVTLNAMLHESDMDGLEACCEELSAIGVTAAIVSDLGVLRYVRRSSDLRIHLSTQASCLNAAAARFYRDLGVDRIVLGRELTLRESGAIARAAGVEVEVFGHGAMCMSFSGNCTISNFTAGRDSNRGGCAHSCRFDYSQADADGAALGQFLSSRDLMAIRQLGAFAEAGIHSVKIEGRMKSAFYVATATRAYREVLDAIAAGSVEEATLARAEADLRTVPHRDYFSGSLVERAGTDSVYQHEGGHPTAGSHRYLGLVLEVRGDRVALRLSAPVHAGQTVEFLPRVGAAQPWQVTGLTTIDGRPVDHARQDHVVVLRRQDLPGCVDVATVVRAQLEG